MILWFVSLRGWVFVVCCFGFGFVTSSLLVGCDSVTLFRYLLLWGGLCIGVLFFLCGLLGWV